MDVVMLSKLGSLVLFVAIFSGVSVWALFRLKPEQVEHMRQVPFQED